MTGPLSTIPAPASQQLLGIPAPAVHLILLIAALGSFGFILWKRLSVLRLASSDPRDFTPDQIWVLIRAIKVQSQVLQLYVGQPEVSID